MLIKQNLAQHEDKQATCAVEYVLVTSQNPNQDEGYQDSINELSESDIEEDLQSDIEVKAIFDNDRIASETSKQEIGESPSSQGDNKVQNNLFERIDKKNRIYKNKKSEKTCSNHWWYQTKSSTSERGIFNIQQQILSR